MGRSELEERQRLPGGMPVLPGGVCRAVVLACIDYRFVEPLHGFLSSAGLLGAADLLAWPGGALGLLGRERDAVTEAMHRAFELHGPSDLILTVHEDCGAIGGSRVFPGREAEISALETSLGLAARHAVGLLPARHVRLLRFDGRGSVDVAGPSSRRDGRMT